VIRFADLHLHSNASDGALSPGALVELACSKGLRVISITDHDTVEGLAEAMAVSRTREITVVPGVEISASVDASDCHVLGYWIDHMDARLLRELERFRRLRVARAKEMLAALRRLGAAISWDAIDSRVDAGTLGRPHIALALVEAGYAVNVQDAFERYLGRGRPAYVPRPKVTPARAIRMIREAGGIAVLAHPRDLVGLVPDLAAAGLGGLEVYYPGYDEKLIGELTELAARYDLLATGGSDFHGHGSRPDDGLGEVDMPRECVEALLAAGQRQPTRSDPRHVPGRQTT
jgi:predicted metal-dependent phosphoesterase TrpH